MSHFERQSFFFSTDSKTWFEHSLLKFMVKNKKFPRGEKILKILFQFSDLKSIFSFWLMKVPSGLTFQAQMIFLETP